jgi:hypothetical protein
MHPLATGHVTDIALEATKRLKEGEYRQMANGSLHRN